MTYEMQKSLERELKDAKNADDITKAQSHILLALMDCQRKTADRVKNLSWKVFAVVFALGSGGGAVASNLDKITRLFGGG